MSAFRRRLILVLCSAWLLTSPASAAARNEWLRVTTPDFTIMTTLAEPEAAAWAGEFAQYVAALRTYFHRDALKLPPLTIVVFAQDREFALYRPLNADGEGEMVAGFFARHESWGVAGLAGTSAPDELRATIFHEGVHWFLSFDSQVYPVWLNEGLAEVFSTFRATDTQAEWGAAIESHVALLRQETAVSLEEVVSTAHDGVFGGDQLRTGIVYAKSWALAHFLIYGKHDIPRSALGDYARLLQTDGAPDEAFRRAFGCTYAEMDARLANYLRAGQYFVTRLPLTQIDAPQIEPATRFEVENALSRLALGGHRWKQAREHAEIAVNIDRADPRGHEALAFALQADRDAAGALAEFKLAKERGSKDFAPYFQTALAAQFAGRTRLPSPADARAMATDYEKALNLHPRYQPAYQNLANVLAYAEPTRPSDQEFLDQGQQLFPRDPFVRLGRVILLKRSGDTAQARTELDALLKAESDLPSNLVGIARQLDAGWEGINTGERIKQLGGEQKYAEAITLIDEQLDKNERSLPAGLRSELFQMRDEFEAALFAQKLQEALAQENWSEARRIAKQIDASNAASDARAQARDVLNDLDRRGLGREKPADEKP